MLCDEPVWQLRIAGFIVVGLLARLTWLHMMEALSQFYADHCCVECLSTSCKRHLIKNPYEPYEGLIFYDLIKNSSVLKALSFPWLETNIVEIIQLSTTCFLKGITLEQFLRFGMFLNNLEDFSLAMRIYSIAGQAVTQGTATNISPLCFISCFEFISICEGAHRENSFPFYKSKLTYRKYLVNMVVESHSGFFFPWLLSLLF